MLGNIRHSISWFSLYMSVGMMLARFAPALRLAASTAKPAVAVRCMGHVPEGHMSPTELVKHTGANFDNLPVPAGSWQENYDKYQKKFNTQLALSVVMVVATWIIMEKTGTNIFHYVKDYRKLNIDPSKPPIRNDD